MKTSASVLLLEQYYCPEEYQVFLLAGLLELLQLVPYQECGL